MKRGNKQTAKNGELMKHTFLLEVETIMSRKAAEIAVLSSFAKRDYDNCRFDLKRKAPRIQQWISVKDKLPRDGQRVVARYKGVYDYRIVIFWYGISQEPHFGHPAQSDGKGSQPATHWMPLLK